MVVRGARCLAGRLLCLADPATECPGAGRRAVADQVRASFLASDRTYGARRVWHDLLADGDVLRPASDRAADAARGVARTAPTASDASRYRRAVDERRRAECARPAVRRRLRRTANGSPTSPISGPPKVALRRRGRGSLLPAGGRLVHAGDDDGATRHRCAVMAIWRRGKPDSRAASLGSREPVHQ